MKKLLQLCSVLMLGLLFLAGTAQAQTLYVAGTLTGSDANNCSTPALACATVRQALSNVTLPGAVINVYGNTNETGAAITWPAVTGVTLRGVTSGSDTTPAMWTISQVAPTSENDHMITVGAGATNATITSLQLEFASIPTYSFGRFLRIADGVSGVVVDNVTFNGGAGNAVGPAVVSPVGGGTNFTIRNSTFTGNFARRTLEITAGSNILIENNLFEETHVGTDADFDVPAFAGNGASVYHGINTVTGVTIRFNRFASTIINATAGNNGTYSAIYFTGSQLFGAGNELVIDHNTIALDGTAYTLGNVNGITFADAGNPGNVVTNLTNGWIQITNNVITGATDFGVSVPVAFGTSNMSYNLFHDNGTNSDNVIETIAPGNNIASPTDTGTDPLFDGTDEFGYLAGSPALNSSSQPGTPGFWNRGYNQEFNSTAPQVNALTASGTAPQNASSPFLHNHPILIDWTFVDPDPQDTQQTDFLLQISTEPTFTIPGDIVYEREGVADEMDGTLTELTIPAFTLQQGFNGGSPYYVRVTATDASGLTGFADITIETEDNTPPTAGTFLVDDVSANPAVNNSNPKYSFIYDDEDDDNMQSVTINVYRVSANCALAPNCPPLVPTTDPAVSAANSILIASKTFTVGGLEIPGPVAPGDLVELNHYQLSAIIGPILGDEDYEWTVEVVDADGASSGVYGPGAVAPNLDATLVFSTVGVESPSFSDLEIDGKDNTEIRVVVGNPVPANAPIFSWVYTGFDDMSAFEIEITRTGTGPNVLPATIVSAADPNVTALGSKAYEYVHPGAAITDGRIYTARIRVINQLGERSDWQSIQYTRNSLPSASDMSADAAALILSTPTEETDDIFPLLTWTFTDADLADAPNDEGQSAFHIQIFDNPGFVGTPIIDTGKTSSTTSEYQVGDLLLLYDTIYYVRMRVWDQLDVPNHTSNWITMGAFETPVNDAPSVAITLDTAADGSPATNFTLNATPTFDWTFTDPEGRDQFQYGITINDLTASQSYTLITPSNPVPGNGASYVLNAADFDNSFPGLAAGHDYEFELTVWDTDSDGSGSGVAGNDVTEVYPFRFVTLPSAASAMAVSPLRAGGAVNSLTPDLTFTPEDADGEDAISFRIQIQDDTNTNIAAPVDINTGAPYAVGTPVNVTWAQLGYADLTANSNYRWRVRTTDAHGVGAWSVWQTFTVDPIPGEPTIDQIYANADTDVQLNLPNGSSVDGSFTVVWTDDDHGDNAAQYGVQIFDAANAVLIETIPVTSATVVSPGVSSGNFIPTTALTPGTTYTLRLQVTDAAGVGHSEWSLPVATSQFRISAAPTIADLQVDGVTNNPNVLNVFPVFSWDYDDVDADAQTSVEIVVTRTTTLCGGLPVCQPAPYLTWSSGKIAHSDPFITYGNSGPVIEGILPGESYTWTLVVWDANDIPSVQGNGTFTAGANLPTGISNVTIDTKDYVAGGSSANRWDNPARTVETATPTFAWNFGGPGTQAKYQIDVTTDPNFTGGFVWQTGEHVSTDQTVVYGAFGSPTALVTGTTYYARIRAFNGQNIPSAFEYIKFELNEAPAVVTTLTADGENILVGPNPGPVVDDRIPTIAWTFEDNNLPDDSQTAFRIEIWNGPNFNPGAPNFESEVYDSGKMMSSDQFFTIPVNELAFGQNYFLRITVWDEFDVTSGVSSVGRFSTPPNATPTVSDLLVLDGTPAPNLSQILSLTPDFSWTFADTDGHGQGFYQIQIFNSGDLVTPIYDTGIETDATTSHTYDTSILASLQWNSSYRVVVNVWDDFQDPINFPADPFATTFTDFTTSIFNLTPVSLVINPTSTFQNGSATATATLSTPGAYATLMKSNGMTEVWFTSVHDSDHDGIVEFTLDNTNTTNVAGNYTFRLFETPVEVANTPSDLAGLIGANFESATLEVVPGAIVIGDANLNGAIWFGPGDTNYDLADIVATLQYTVFLVDFDSNQMLRANVDNSADLVNPGDRVNVGDVVLMQQRSLGVIPCFPHPLDAGNCPPPKSAEGVEFSKVELAKGGFQWDGMVMDPVLNTVEVPVILNGSDIMGYQLKVSFAESGVSLREVRFETSSDWMNLSNEVEGSIHLAGIGSSAMGAGRVATLVFDLNGAQSAKVTVSGMVNNTAAPTQTIELVSLPEEYRLSQNYPNPFNPSTVIEFSLPEAQNVVLEVYNTAGQKVATLVNQKMNAGTHVVNFNASRLASGVYVYRLQAGSFQAIQKMTLIK